MEELDRYYRELGLRNRLAESGVNPNILFKDDGVGQQLFYNVDGRLPLSGLLDLNVGVRGSNIDYPNFEDDSFGLSNVGMTLNDVFGGLLNVSTNPEDKEIFLNFMKRY